MADLQRLVDDLSKLTVLEAADLAKMLEEKWGVSAAAAVAVAAAPGGAGAAAPVEEKTEFTAVLAAIGEDRKSTRLNSSHTVISYAVFCLKKKKHVESARSEFVLSADGIKKAFTTVHA